MLHLALFAEGPTDHRFLGQVLSRLADDLCRGRGIEEIAIPPMLELHSPPRLRGQARGARIHAAVAENSSAVDLLFVHADGNSDASRARAERVDPALERVTSDDSLPHIRGVPVIPVRATEAWCLVDGDALRAVFCTTLDDRALGLPPTACAAEQRADPKQDWDAVARRAQRRRSRTSIGEYYEPIGARVRLSCLRRLVAFESCERDLAVALLDLGFVRT